MSSSAAAVSVSGTAKLVAAAALTGLTCSQGVLMEASKVNGKYPYSVATVPFFSELVKLCVSAYVLSVNLARDRSATHVTTHWASVLLYPIPSLLYLVHNNVQFYTMSYVDPATYQILGNLKIVTTGILFRFALRRRLTRVQWSALVLLTAGAATSQIPTSYDCTGEPGEPARAALAAPVMGYAFGILSACLSALAGVYTEYLLKRNNDSLYWQNVQLYGFGTLFNALRLTIDDIRSGHENGIWVFSSLKGYNWITFLIVANFSFAGLFVSWIMKFADTIVKVYATSSAMFLTTLLSIWLFDLRPNLQLFLGIVVACTSLHLYFLPPEKIISLPEVSNSHKV